jgi:hypothetical protein
VGDEHLGEVENFAVMAYKRETTINEEVYDYELVVK